ncbi:MAG TPA: hypothetical protein VFK61_05145 [Candidatus Limnocylindria bacterium]|nr:hypothetical protein [Candidatus Limnocylindria bacterium]
MSVERMPEGVPPASALPKGSDPSDGSDADAAARRALRVQMLATEHWSLLATRSLSWNEAFARAGMFLSLLSGAIVALALVAQATQFGEGFMVFALLTLPVVLFVGLATYVRLLEINNEDYVWVRGMNRLRGAYQEIDPEVGRYFITGTTEQPLDIFRSYGSTETGFDSGRFHGFVTTPSTIGFVDAMVAAVLAAIVVVQLNIGMVSAAAVGVVAFLITGVILGWIGYRNQRMATLYDELPHGTRPGKTRD